MSKEVLNELTEKQQENKKEDKKALGKFLAILVFGFFLGIGVGLGSIFVGHMMEENDRKESLLSLMQTAVIYGSYIYTTILLITCVVLQRKSRREYTAWDEEDEEILAGIETKISYVNWFANLIMYGAYFFFSTGVWAVDITGMESALKQDETMFWTELGLVFAHMFYAMAAACIVQQRAVNLLKEINPEKTGSIYDMKFRDKWLEHCDEAERFATYKCSYKTFKTMHAVGIVLWVICLVGQMVFGTSVFATIIVTVYLIIQTSVYSVQGIFFAKHPSEVMK